MSGVITWYGWYYYDNIYNILFITDKTFLIFLIEFFKGLKEQERLENSLKNSNSYNIR